MDRIIEDNRKIKPKHWKIIIPCTMVLALIIFTATRNNVTTYKIEKEKLQIARVIEGEFEDYIKINGNVEPISTIYLDAAEGGKVEEILITEGSYVQKGNIILKLKNNRLNLTILDSEAQLAEKSNFLREILLRMEQQKLDLNRNLLNQEFQLKRQKRDYERKKLLFEQGLIAEEEFLLSEENYTLSFQLLSMMKDRKEQDSIFRKIQIEQMNDNLNNMRKNLDFVHQRLENLNVKAPVDGQLGRLDAEIGQSVSEGRRIGQINVLTSYKINCQIDEYYIDRLRPGLIADLERNGEKYRLVLKKVYPEVRDGIFRIDLVFKDSVPENIRTGQTYYADLKLGDPKVATLIDKGGFFNSTGGQWVYVLDETNSFATKRNIKTGRQNPKYFEILEGLLRGEKVIISDYSVFGENEKIILK